METLSRGARRSGISNRYFINAFNPHLHAPSPYGTIYLLFNYTAEVNMDPSYVEVRDASYADAIAIETDLVLSVIAKGARKRHTKEAVPQSEQIMASQLDRLPFARPPTITSSASDNDLPLLQPLSSSCSHSRSHSFSTNSSFNCGSTSPAVTSPLTMTTLTPAFMSSDSNSSSENDSSSRNSSAIHEIQLGSITIGSGEAQSLEAPPASVGTIGGHWHFRHRERHRHGHTRHMPAATITAAAGRCQEENWQSSCQQQQLLAETMFPMGALDWSILEKCRWINGGMATCI